jgi:hypothetical protein
MIVHCIQNEVNESNSCNPNEGDGSHILSPLLQWWCIMFATPFVILFKEIFVFVNQAYCHLLRIYSYICYFLAYYSVHP